MPNLLNAIKNNINPIPTADIIEPINTTVTNETTDISSKFNNILFV
jgi:hypothetical protein